MKQFNLEEYLKNPSRKVVTRDGREARVICTDRADENYPIIALVKIKSPNGIEWCESFTIDGKNSVRIKESDLDLFFAPEKNEGWLNIYHTDKCEFYISPEHPYKSKREAEAVAAMCSKNFFTTIKVEWEE